MKKIWAIIFIVGIMILCLCSCDGPKSEAPESTEAKIVENFQYEILDGHGEWVMVYTFVDSETGIEYLVCSNNDGICITPRTTTNETVETPEFDWETD